MTITITTPRGAKVRSASARRFVVVREYSTDSGLTWLARVERRSDSVSTVRDFVRRNGDSSDHGPHVRVRRSIFDQRTLSWVPLSPERVWV